MLVHLSIQYVARSVTDLNGKIHCNFPANPEMGEASWRQPPGARPPAKPQNGPYVRSPNPAPCPVPQATTKTAALHETTQWAVCDSTGVSLFCGFSLFLWCRCVCFC